MAKANKPPQGEALVQAIRDATEDLFALLPLLAIDPEALRFASSDNDVFTLGALWSTLSRGVSLIDDYQKRAKTTTETE